MKNSAVHAKEVKTFFNRLKRSGPKPTTYDSSDYLQQFVFTVLSEGNSLSKAKTATTRLMNHMIDYNDLRVSTPEELTGVIEDDLADVMERTTTLVRILNAIYERENSVTLDAARIGTKKDTIAYLESLERMTPYVLAGIMLWSFDEHAIPVDEQMLAVLKRENLVDAEADVYSAQAFLKRQIKPGDAKLFTALLKRNVAQRTPRSPDLPSTRKAKSKV